MKKIISLHHVIILLVLLVTACSGCTSQNAITTDTYTNSIGMEFIEVPAGDFEMYSGKQALTKPSVHVNISKSYYMGKYEVTQGQWNQIMNENPSYHIGNDLPVERMTWTEATDFIDALNELEGTKKYRLPSEAEWEYAARGGVNTSYTFGENYSLLQEYEWCKENGNLTTHPVGTKKPNEWGLHDVSGNVNELVTDVWHVDTGLTPTDGTAYLQKYSYPDQLDRTIKGGYYLSSWVTAELGHRFEYQGATASSSVGFRVLMEK